MHAHHVFRTLGKGCNFVHIECGCVGSQNSTRLHDFIKLLKDSFFHAHLFKHRFNDQVGAANVVIAQGGAEQSHALLILVLLELAFFNLRFVIFANGGNTAV